MQKEYCAVIIKSNENNERNYYSINNDSNKNMFYYIEKDKTITSYDYQNDILKRENEEMQLEYQFKLNSNTTNSIFIKQLNKKFNIDIFTKEIVKTSTNLKIVYTIDNQEFTYEIRKEIA